MADPTRDLIAAPLAAYDAIAADQQPLGAAVSAFFASLSFNTPAELAAAFQGAIAGGPAGEGQTPTAAQAMAAAFNTHAALIKALGPAAVLAFKAACNVAGIPRPCVVSAVDADPTVTPA